jgi:hypothetical protein
MRPWKDIWFMLREIIGWRVLWIGLFLMPHSESKRKMVKAFIEYLERDEMDPQDIEYISVLRRPSVK